jgi:hypothetical protein
MIINGKFINTVQELEEAIVDMDESSQEAMRGFFKENLRIRALDLIHDDFKYLENSKVDFTVHLKDGVNLIKKYEMLPNGRPAKSKYYWPTVDEKNLICEIKFEFTNNLMGFMTRRIEKLGYYSIGGKVAEYTVISDRTFDFTNIQEASLSVRERSDARSNIMNEIKTYLNGFLMAYYPMIGKTYADVMNDGGAFWKSYLPEIQSWIETASTDFKNKLNADTANQILNITMAPSVTIRTYIISRITY